MKKVFLALILALILISCSMHKESLELPALSNPNLKYYGFTLIDVLFDDPTDDFDQVNYLNEVASFTNLADILVIGPSHNIIDNLEAMDALDVSAFLHLHELFFELKEEGGDKSGFVHQLREDYQSRWSEFSSVNDLKRYSSYITAFYIGEEATWNGISSQDLEKACNLLKETYPEVRVMIIEAAPALDDLVIPETVDWVGFDHYFIKDPFTNATYNQELEILKSKMNEKQEIVVVLDSHFLPLQHRINGIRKNDLDEVALSYLDIANSDTSVVGLVGYFWPNGFESANSLGARGLPESVQEQYSKIGKLITGK